MYRHRSAAAGRTMTAKHIFFGGNNDDATEAQRPIDYAAIQAVIADASDATEDGNSFQVQTAGTLTTQVEVSANAIGFFGATPATQATAITDVNTTATTGTLPAASDTNRLPTLHHQQMLSYCSIA